MNTPPSSDSIRQIVDERLKAIPVNSGPQETVRVEWRGQTLDLPVISMPVSLLYYNPETHRTLAQRSSDPERERQLLADPWGQVAQDYLHELLKGDPSDPKKVDPNFITLKEDLENHGQIEPGIITRGGVLINGNTRCAAMKDLGLRDIRVAVLPPDAAKQDTLTIELSLQLRRDHKRDYSYMNSLLALEERANEGLPLQSILDAFRITAATYDKRRWILNFVKEVINRSKKVGTGGREFSLSLMHFENHQGRLDEIYAAYTKLKATDPDKAEALLEQRLLALAMDKSKTDLRAIEYNFVQTFMPVTFSKLDAKAPPPLKIPGLEIQVSAGSAEVEALRQLATGVLQAHSVKNSRNSATLEELEQASKYLVEITTELEPAVDRAIKEAKFKKKRFAPADRISDACDSLRSAVESIADARRSGTGTFDANDLDDVLLTLRSDLEKLSLAVSRHATGDSDGLSWIKAVGQIS